MNIHSPEGLLQAYLAADCDVEADCHLAQMLEEYARPLVVRIIHSVVRAAENRHEVDDIVADVQLHLLRRFREARRESSAGDRIRDVRGYVATTAYNCCHEKLRQIYPGRHRLRNHLRYF